MKLTRRTDKCDIQSKDCMVTVWRHDTEKMGTTVAVEVVGWCEPHYRLVVLKYFGTLGEVERE